MTNFKNALNNAKKVLDNATAEKTDVNSALKSLNTAKANLKKKPVVDKKELQNQIIENVENLFL